MTRLRTQVCYAVFFLVNLLLSPTSFASTVQVIQTPDGLPYRILPGLQPNELWIVDRGTGFFRLYESGGLWDLENIETGHMNDACGPDSLGRLYCSFYGSDVPGGGMFVFDASTHAILDSRMISPDFPVKGLTLSSDETSLFLVGKSWPGSWVESASHSDSGIIWEIDLTSPTYDIVDQGITAALPETIFYSESEFGPDKLFVFTGEVSTFGDPFSSRLDVISVESGLPRVSQIYAGHMNWNYSNTIIDWPYGEHLIALCNSSVYHEMDIERYLHGLWIIHT